MAGELIAGPPSDLGNGLLNGAGWAINLAVAEWVIRRRPAPPTLAARKRPIQQRSASFAGGSSGAQPSFGNPPS